MKRKPVPICAVMLCVILLSAPAPAHAGRHCGAEGDWRSELIPDQWPPAKARGTIPVVGGSVRVVHFSQACKKHDDCYETRGTNRKKCDDRFLADMTRQCEKAYPGLLEAPLLEACRGAAKGYHQAVERYGQPAYAKAQAGAKGKAKATAASQVKPAVKSPLKAQTKATASGQSVSSQTAYAQAASAQAAARAPKLKCRELATMPCLTGLAVSGGKLYILDDAGVIRVTRFNKTAWQELGEAPRGGPFSSDGSRLYAWGSGQNKILVSPAGKISWKPLFPAQKPDLLTASAGQVFVWRAKDREILLNDRKSGAWKNWCSLSGLAGLAGSYGRLFALKADTGLLLVSGAGKAKWKPAGLMPKGRFLAATPNQALTWEPDSGIIWMCRTR